MVTGCRKFLRIQCFLLVYIEENKKIKIVTSIEYVPLQHIPAKSPDISPWTDYINLIYITDEKINISHDFSGLRFNLSRIKNSLMSN